MPSQEATSRSCTWGRLEADCAKALPTRRGKSALDEQIQDATHLRQGSRMGFAQTSIIASLRSGTCPERPTTRATPRMLRIAPRVSTTSAERSATFW